MSAADVIAKYTASLDIYFDFPEDEERFGVDMLVALKAAGYAVVELPEPDDDFGGLTQETWHVGNLTVHTMGSSVLWPTAHKKGWGALCEEDSHTHNGCQPEWARKLGAALLAAADAAEVAA